MSTFDPQAHHRPLRERRLIAAGVGLGVLATAVAAFLATTADLGPLRGEHWAEVWLVGGLLALGPYGLFRGREAKRVAELEKQFPDFLRDVATNHRAGLTLAKSIQVAADGSYGALSPEIRTMADQIAWNVPLEEVLRRLGERTRAPLIRRTMGLIVRASRSGGNTAEVILAAARDARELKTIELERRTGMSLYTAIIYLTFFIFLGIVAALYLTLLPKILSSSAAALESGFAALAGTGRPVPTTANFRHLYLLAAAVQGVGNGLVAGLLTTGRAADGVRHAFVMLAAALAVFVVLP